MSGKYSNHLSILIIAICVSPMQMAVGQTGPGGGYAKIPKGAHSIIAEIRAKPGKREDLRAATLPLIHLVRSDPKNLVYFLQEDREDPGHFSFYEVFATKQDFEAHYNMPYVKEWFAKLPELAERGVHATRMEIKPAAGRQG